MITAPETAVSKRELLTFIYKHRRRLLCAFWIPFILCITLSFVPTPRYKASSVLIIRLGAEYVYNPEISDSQTGDGNPIPFNPLQIYKSEVAILGSDDLHAEVINAIGVEKLFPELSEFSLLTYINNGVHNVLYDWGVLERATPEEIARVKLARAVDLFDKRFDIELEKESAVMDVYFENRDAGIAAQTLNTLLDMYMEKRKAIYLEPRAELALKEMEASRKHAHDAALAVQQFKLKHNLYSLSDEREELLERRGKALEQAALVSNAGLEKKIAEYNRELKNFDNLERELSLQQKEAQIAGESYSLYSHKYDEAKAFEDLEHGRLDSVRVIQPPIVPAEPHRLQLLIIIAGAMLSVFSVLVSAAILKFLENGFQTSEQIEQLLGVKVLATFGKSVTEPDENIRHLASRINKGIITFLSARAGEGTSDIAWNYAARLAKESDKKVLLIDAEKFSAERYRLYNFTPGIGIIDAYIDSKRVDEISHAISDRLSVCRFINEEKNRGSVRQIIHAEDFWKNLRELFGHIVIDAGALQTSFDGIMLSAKSDAAVIVIEAEKTPQAVVRNLYNVLLATGADIAGAVMNGYRHYIPERVYKRL